MSFRFCVSFVLVLSWTHLAQANLTGQMQGYITSDKVNKTDATFLSPRYSGFDVEGQLSSLGLNNQQIYQGTRVAPGFYKKNQQWEWTTYLGLHHLHSIMRQKSATSLYTRSLLSYEGQQAHLLLSIEHDFLYTDSAVFRTNDHFLTQTSLSPALIWRFSEKIRLSFRPSIRAISDGNQRTFWDSQVSYGISPGWPWIWLGFGYQELKFKQET